MATPLRYCSWTTTDLEEARARLEGDFGARLRLDEARATDRQLSVHRRGTANFLFGMVRLPAQLSFDCNDSDLVIVNTMRAGRIGGDGPSHNFSYQRGEVFLAGFPGARYRCHTDHTAVHSVAIPTRFLTEATGAAPSLRFLSVNPVTPAAAAAWMTTIAEVERILEDPATHTPLVLCEAARVLSERIVATFPTTTTPGVSQPGRLMPLDLRRVIAYMEDHADTDISVWDIARAVDLTPAGVAYLFRRYLDSTPMAHLRRIRLDRAHRELVDADPGRTTVGRVAARWGFPNTAKFAAFYRSCYEQSPYVTIRE
jgi:AraC-like DNA-binding protein